MKAPARPDIEKLIAKALARWKAREIALHFYGTKPKGRIVWIAE